MYSSSRSASPDITSSICLRTSSVISTPIQHHSPLRCSSAERHTAFSVHPLSPSAESSPDDFDTTSRSISCIPTAALYTQTSSRAVPFEARVFHRHLAIHFEIVRKCVSILFLALSLILILTLSLSLSLADECRTDVRTFVRFSLSMPVVPASCVRPRWMICRSSVQCCSYRSCRRVHVPSTRVSGRC